jgi:hypothetical protein
MSAMSAPLDRSAAVTGLLTVVAANVLYLTGLSLIFDPMLSMDPLYIDLAQHPISSILREDPSWGLLYAVWLKPFVAVLGDPVAVYAANVYALSVGVSLLIYLYLLLLTRRAAAGVGAALFFLIGDFNVPLAGKVSEFAVLVALAGLTVSELVPAGARRMAVAAAGVLFASYVRPELYPAALCLCLAAAWLARKELGESGWRVVLWPATDLASILVLAVWIGTPVFSPSHSGDRLLIAFQEHFAWNWSRWHHGWQDYASIWEHEFGTAHTTLQALLNNPGAVAHHLADNFLGTARFMAGSAFDHYPLLAPATSPLLVSTENLLVSAAALASLMLVASRAELRRQMVDRYGHAFFPCATIATVSLGSAIAIFPLARYLVIPGVLLLFAAALAATLIIPARPVTSWRSCALAGVVCLVAIPRPFVLPSAYVVPGSPFKGRIAVTRPIIDTIAFIRSLGLSAPVQVLTFTDGIGEMLGTGFHEIKVWQKGAQPLDAYIRDNHVDVIISMEPGQDSFLVKDPYWAIVQNNPDAAGFTRLAIPNQEAVRVFVRTDRMQKSGT